MRDTIPSTPILINEVIKPVLILPDRSSEILFIRLADSREIVSHARVREQDSDTGEASGIRVHARPSAMQNDEQDKQEYRHDTQNCFDGPGGWEINAETALTRISRRTAFTNEMNKQCDRSKRR